MEAVVFLGDSLSRVRDFPETARATAGFQLHQLQLGLDPEDWKPMTSIGPGVREIRIRDAAGAFRVIYLAKLEDRVLVLHAFSKKTQKTAQKDIDLAAARLRAWRR